VFHNCSSSLALDLLLLLGLPLLVRVVALFNRSADLGHLHVIDLIVVLLHVALSAVASLTVTLVLATFGSGLDTDVLRGVRLLVELVGEVLGHNVTTVFVVLLQDDSFQLLAHSHHDFVETESHGFFLEIGDLLSELPINFLGDAGGPRGDLVVGELNFLVDLLSLFIQLKVCGVLPSEFSQFRGDLRLALSLTLVLLLVLIVVHLQLLELSAPVLVIVA